MSKEIIISQEMIALNANRELGPTIEALIGQIRKAITAGDSKKPLYDQLSAVLSSTGMHITFTTNTSRDLNGWANPANILGHSGSRYHEILPSVAIREKTPRNDLVMIDLKNVRITGELTKLFKMNITLTMGLLDPTNGLTDAEITSLVLHELGHCFNLFMTLGDYVWLNYYLTEGIEVLTGKKANSYKLELFDETWLKQNLPAEQYQTFANARTEKNARRVVLSMYKKTQRHHLTDNSRTAMRREEQLADMFATRLGYGKPLATCLARIEKFHDHSGRMAHVTSTIILSLIMVVFAPFTILGIMLAGNPNELNMHARYDNPGERLMKIRRDLVMQLRHTQDPDYKQVILADIDAIDALFKGYTKYKSVADYVMEFFRPSIRKSVQNTEMEETLETLMNNDLFIHTNRIA